MTVRDIPHNASLDLLWDELVYTEARLLKDPHSRARARPITELIARAERVQQAQRAAWRAEIVAQAGVDAADDGLDEVVEDFERDLRHSVKDDRTVPTYKRYFAHPLYEVLRLGLASELDKVRTWPEAIRSEPEHALRPHAAKFEHAVDTGAAALSERESAAGATATHRAREIIALFDDTNAARRSLHAVLSKYAADHRLAKSWPDRFFKHGSRAPTAAADAPAPATSAPTTTPTT